MARKEHSRRENLPLPLRITWVIGKMLGLASFSFPIDDVEIHLHSCANVLVTILWYFYKKHALKQRKVTI